MKKNRHVEEWWANLSPGERELIRGIRFRLRGAKLSGLRIKLPLVFNRQANRKGPDERFATHGELDLTNPERGHIW